MKRRGLQILGVLAVVAGGGIGLLLIRAFIAGKFGRLWIVVGDLLLLALVAYLIFNGIRLVSIGEGMPRPKTRFGWGKMLVGSWIIYSAAGDYFHFIPKGPIKTLEPSNATQASAMHATQIAVLIGCVFLIISGFWQGFRKKQLEPNT
jgi:hypothetical protein